MRPFCEIAGSVIGREHVRLGRNNQDAVGLFADERLIVAAVADGCSSSRASEVGARLAVEWIAASAPRSSELTPHALISGLLDFIACTAAALSADGEVSPEIIGDYFLFTLIVAVLTPERTLVFSAGDGLVAIDGEVRVLDSGEANAPEYPAYALLGAALEPSIVFDGPTARVRSVLIATDGAAELPRGVLAELAADPRYRKNPSLLHKRLVVLGANEGRLRDDTTIVLIRREPEEES